VNECEKQRERERERRGEERDTDTPSRTSLSPPKLAQLIFQPGASSIARKGLAR